MKILRTLKLSAKALKKERREFEDFLGISPAENVRVVVISDSQNPSKKFHHFFYIDNTTRTVVGAPEYRIIDSYFSDCTLDYKPKMQYDEFDIAIDELHKTRSPTRDEDNLNEVITQMEVIFELSPDIKTRLLG